MIKYFKSFILIININKYMNRINHFLQNEIFSYIPITKSIDLTFGSKKYIEIIQIKRKKNAYNFCQLYINKNKCPSLKTLYLRFSDILSNSDILDIFLYFLKQYEVKANKNKVISLYYDLNIELSKEFLNLRKNIKSPINLIIKNKETIFDKNLNFQNIENVDKFSLFYNNKCNSIGYTESDLFNYYLILKYCGHLIPYSVSSISLVYSNSSDDFLNTLNLYKKEYEIFGNNLVDIDFLDKNKDNARLIKKYLLELIFKELSNYKNIKEFMFKLNSGEIDNLYNINELLKENNPFLLQLKKIKIEESPKDYFLEVNNELRKYKNIEFVFFSSFNFSDIEKNIKNFQLNENMNIEVYDLDDILSNKTFFQKIKSLYIKFIFLKEKIKNLKILNNVLSLISFNSLTKLNFYEIEASDEYFLDNIIQNLNKNCQNLNFFEIYKFISKKRQKIKNQLCLKQLHTLYIDSNCIDYNEQIFRNKISNFCIDELDSLKKICFPFEFEVNNEKILNQIESIDIRFIQNGHEEFLCKILGGKSLKNIHITFRAPLKNKKLLEIFFNNLKNIELVYVEIANIEFYKGEKSYDDTSIKYKRKKECYDNTYEKSLKFYVKCFNNIIKNISLEKLLPNVKYMEIIPNCKYHQNYEEMNEQEKLAYLKKYPFLKQVCGPYYSDFVIDGYDLSYMILNSKFKERNDNFTNNSQLITNLFKDIY